MRKAAIENNDPQSFDIEFGSEAAHVTVHTIKSAKIFHLVFNSRKPDLNLTIATGNDGNKFWTSIPEGRKETELAGKAIAAYLRDYRRTAACVTTTDKKLAAPSLFD